MLSQMTVDELIARALRAALATDKTLRRRAYVDGEDVDVAAAYNAQVIASLNVAKRKTGEHDRSRSADQHPMRPVSQ